MKESKTFFGKTLGFKNISILKRKVMKAMLALVTLLAVWTVGTFNPNSYVIGNIKKDTTQTVVKEAVNLGLYEPAFEYTNRKEFILATEKCINYLNYTTQPEHRIPTVLIVAMAGIESGWGTSRFATQGNNLFGIRTWDPKDKQMKPLDLPNASFGVKSYESKCASVQHMLDLVNNHSAYEDFRILRDSGETNPTVLVGTLSKWSENTSYVDLIRSTIINLQKD